LSNPATNGDSRLTLPPDAVLPRAITIEIKAILTFDNVRIISAIDADTSVCYTKLIGKSGDAGTFIDTPLDMIAARPDQPVRENSVRSSESANAEVARPRTEMATTFEQDSASGDYLLCSNGKVLGCSALEKTKSAHQRTGRFFPSDDYYEVAEIFEQFPTVENDWLEANVREAYGLTDNDASDFRRKFNDLCERIDALKLYVGDASGKQIATTEVKLEDLSTFYRDESERWLHVRFATPLQNREQ
jgi:hypothetical protein